MICLYGSNQIALPPPPAEWNRETHPFAVATCNNYNNTRSFVVSSVPCYASVGDSGTGVLTRGDGYISGQTYEITKGAPGEFVITSSGDAFYGLMYEYVIWSNFDIYTQNGDLYFPKCSDPVECPEYSPSLTLYNGTSAPAIQAWAKAKYKCALLAADGDGANCRLYLSTTPLLYKQGSLLVRALYGNADGESSAGWLNITLDGWEHYPENEHSYAPGEKVVSMASYTPIWANYDLREYENESNVILPASKVKLNPALLVQSFFTGQALRRNRNG